MVEFAQCVKQIVADLVTLGVHSVDIAQCVNTMPMLDASASYTIVVKNIGQSPKVKSE